MPSISVISSGKLAAIVLKSFLSVKLRPSVYNESVLFLALSLARGSGGKGLPSLYLQRWCHLLLSGFLVESASERFEFISDLGDVIWFDESPQIRHFLILITIIASVLQSNKYIFFGIKFFELVKMHLKNNNDIRFVRFSVIFARNWVKNGEEYDCRMMILRTDEPRVPVPIIWDAPWYNFSWIFPPHPVSISRQLTVKCHVS